MTFKLPFVYDMRPSPFFICAVALTIWKNMIKPKLYCYFFAIKKNHFRTILLYQSFLTSVFYVCFYILFFTSSQYLIICKMYNVLFYFFPNKYGSTSSVHVHDVNCIIMHVRIQKHVIHLYERIECRNIYWNQDKKSFIIFFKWIIERIFFVLLFFFNLNCL